MSYDFMKDTYKFFIQIELNETTKNLMNPKNILSYRVFTQTHRILNEICLIVFYPHRIPRRNKKRKMERVSPRISLI